METDPCGTSELKNWSVSFSPHKHLLVGSINIHYICVYISPIQGSQVCVTERSVPYIWPIRHHDRVTVTRHLVQIQSWILFTTARSFWAEVALVVHHKRWHNQACKSSNALYVQVTVKWPSADLKWPTIWSEVSFANRGQWLQWLAPLLKLRKHDLFHLKAANDLSALGRPLQFANIFTLKSAQ